ncbi:hypothetical protein CPB83DRAFT_896481 [Crepidotus variabilis]|uniref:DUF4470 domain-containing protein n=1 Tax=Crepidotus variabilis TaxID=179855 RepID=A0A9P6EBQ5_9AGAR|nr:hypothetical protein CPB83DRAFT_896481 [Crepidotus variabilis]
MAANNALKAKEKGNRLFKEGKIEKQLSETLPRGSVLVRAHPRYLDHLDPKNPVYPSNLSAALYELGDYADAFHSILRSQRLDPEPTIVLKLSARLAKTLSHRLRSGKIHPSVIEKNIKSIQGLEHADSFEHEQSWKLWRTTCLNLASQTQIAYEDRVRLSKIPIFKASPDPRCEYFKFGMDEIMSLFHGWGSGNKDPMNLQASSKEQLEQLAFFFGGAGDARHVYRTIIGLGEEYSRLSTKQQQSIKVPVTINDIHFVAIARNLLHLLIIDKLLSSDLDELARLELEATLVYTYVAWIVPSYVHDRLVAFSKEVKQRLISEPPDLPSWIHVEKISIGAIISAEVRQSWKGNVTIFNGENDEYPNEVLDDFEFIVRIAEFNEDHNLKITDLQAKREWPVFAHVMTFFGGVMDVVKNLKSRLKVEILCGEINSELSKMRLGTDKTRPPDFPRKFMRMWVSNIPDYTQGPLGTALYMLPALQHNVSAAVSANCLLNTGVWKSPDEFCFNYTMLLPRDLKQYLGVHTIKGQTTKMSDIQTLAPTKLPLSLASLPSREELHDWLGRLFLWLIYPGKPKHRPFLIMISFNLAAFTQLLVELNHIGYPSHWLADFLQSILHDTLQTNHTIYTGELPRPVSDLNKITRLHQVRLDPWQAELETILASTRHALPFALLLPEQFASTPQDIGLFKAEPNPNMVFSNSSGLAQSDPVVYLLFYKSGADFNGEGIDDFLGKTLPTLLDGNAKKPEPGSIHIITSVGSVDLKIPEVRWRMSKARVEKMKQEKWSLVVWRTDHYVASKLHVPHR